MKLEFSQHCLPLPDTERILRKCKLIKKEEHDEDLVLSFLNDYKKNFEIINEITLKDFKGGTSISLLSHEIDNENTLKLNTYLEELNSMNIHKFFCDKLSKLEPKISNIFIFHKLAKLLRDFHEEFTKKWDQIVENLVLETINYLHKQQCLLSSGIFNFSSHTISINDLDLLKNGKNMIPPLYSNAAFTKKQF